ncbi:hypothetical protein [Frigoribacterium salinisoli]
MFVPYLTFGFFGGASVGLISPAVGTLMTSALASSDAFSLQGLALSAMVGLVPALITIPVGAAVGLGVAVIAAVARLFMKSSKLLVRMLVVGFTAGGSSLLIAIQMLSAVSNLSDSFRALTAAFIASGAVCSVLLAESAWIWWRDQLS